jgi:DNA invertase Pin-like site-specific DNA recombinase
MPTAYSYLRFSSTIQEKGGSVARQIDERDRWLNKNPAYVLDTTISLKDLGVSAFRGRNLNPAYGDLGKFIDLCERDDSPIEKGSVLLLEKLDRFSRNKPMLAITALGRLIYSGVTVVATADNFHMTEENINDLQVIIPVVVNLCIAHEQSKTKSYHIGQKWEERRKALRDSKQILTKKLPSWLYFDKEENAIRINEEKAEAVRYIFKRTIDGIGQVVLCKEMNAKFKPITTPSKKTPKPNWNTSYLSKLLSDKTLIGEFQPKTKDETGRRIDAGPPVTDYYPQIISEEDFYAAQYQKSLRKKEKSEGKSEFINLFQSLLINKYDKSVMQIATSRTKRLSGEVYLQRRIWSYDKRRGMKNCSNIGLDYFKLESIVLDALTELNPEDFDKRFDGEEERRKLYQEIEGIKKRISELEDALTTLETSSSVENIANSIARLNDRLNEKQIRWDSLSNVNKRNKKDFHDSFKTMEQFKATRENDGDRNIRNKIRGLIPTIIEKIELSLFKKKNNRTICSGVIYLTNGGTRDFKLWDASAVDMPCRTLLYTGNEGGALKITNYGSIEWNPNRAKFNVSAEELMGALSDKEKRLSFFDKVSKEDYFGNPVFFNNQKRICGKKEINILETYRLVEHEEFVRAKPEGGKYHSVLEQLADGECLD